MKIKICGIKYKENLEEIIRLKPDYLGFIFYPKSKRYMVDSLSEECLKSMPQEIKKVGVFVNESIREVLKAVKSYDLKAIQLHGDESPEYIIDIKHILNQLNIKIEIFKAFGIDESFDMEKLNHYKQYCDYFLFDTKTSKYGGSGVKFDWKILKNYDNEVPLILSGGIDVDDIETILKLKGLNIYAIDMNSKLEIEPGLKDIEKVKQVITTFQRAKLLKVSNENK